MIDGCILIFKRTIILYLIKFKLKNLFNGILILLKNILNKKNLEFDENKLDIYWKYL
jgi:hypothetical protein